LQRIPIKKKSRNEAEIMQVVLEEAHSSYLLEIVVEFESEGMEQLESNVTRIVEWIMAWLKSQENR
jgi:adenylate kinase